ncbi:hypothetical protein AB0M45_31905 [Nocardia sp. NPDC051787]|uniref:hypothetical protein n=1 Tax=Nocardia sp. NPDC051787 TaxID=3155415 RepID=UPI00341ABED6
MKADPVGVTPNVDEALLRTAVGIDSCPPVSAVVPNAAAAADQARINAVVLDELVRVSMVEDGSVHPTIPAS